MAVASVERRRGGGVSVEIQLIGPKPEVLEATRMCEATFDVVGKSNPRKSRTGDAYRVYIEAEVADRS